MHIIWYGLSCFKIISKDVTIFTDPFGKTAGVIPPRGAAQIVISSNPDNEFSNNFSSISGNPFIIDGPGEYDIKGVFVRGIPSGKPGESEDEKNSFNRQAIYGLSLEGIRLGFLGGLAEKKLSETQVEELNDIDILLLPVGGGIVGDAEAAANITSELAPKVVVPMYYKTPGISLKLDSVDRFLKEMGGKGEEVEKLLVKKNDLAEEKTRLIFLTPQRGI